MDKAKRIVQSQRDYFIRGRTKDIEFRIRSLKKLKELIKENEDIIFESLKKDLNKSSYESFLTEISTIYNEINFSIKNIRKWTKKKKIKTSSSPFGAKSYIKYEPYGVSLIIAPWNLPFYFLIVPLVGSIAGGNTSILKPSEYTPNVTKVIFNLIEKNFDEEYITVFKGNSNDTSELLKEKFDYIFFTGSESVGKKIMKSASKHLTPLTLELGGKSPCIVDDNVDLSKTAKRIIWGKFINAGQTCVAPDYIFVKKSIKKELIEKLCEYIEKFYGNNCFENNEYPRIVHEKHFDRILNLMNNGKIIYGGKYSRDYLKISPTIITNVNWNDEIMKEEIFGPLLPIIEYNKLEEIVAILNKQAKPLALYIFSDSKEMQEKVINNISYGGGCVNDTFFQMISPNLPFGGVGESGMGSYHGENNFKTFTHKKSLFIQSKYFDFSFRYPPYKRKSLALLKLIKNIQNI